MICWGSTAKVRNVRIGRKTKTVRVAINVQITKKKRDSLVGDDILWKPGICLGWCCYILVAKDMLS